MTLSDPIADMLTRVRNANMVRHDKLEFPASNIKKGDNTFIVLTIFKEYTNNTLFIVFYKFNVFNETFTF